MHVDVDAACAAFIASTACVCVTAAAVSRENRSATHCGRSKEQRCMRARQPIYTPPVYTRRYIVVDKEKGSEGGRQEEKKARAGPLNDAVFVSLMRRARARSELCSAPCQTFALPTTRKRF